LAFRFNSQNGKDEVEQIGMQVVCSCVQIIQVVCRLIFKMANTYMNEWLIYYNRDTAKSWGNGGNGDVRPKNQGVYRNSKHKVRGNQVA